MRPVNMNEEWCVWPVKSPFLVELSLLTRCHLSHERDISYTNFPQIYTVNERKFKLNFDNLNPYKLETPLQQLQNVDSITTTGLTVECHLNVFKDVQCVCGNSKSLAYIYLQEILAHYTLFYKKNNLWCKRLNIRPQCAEFTKVHQPNTCKYMPIICENSCVEAQEPVCTVSW